MDLPSTLNIGIIPLVVSLSEKADPHLIRLINSTMKFEKDVAWINGLVKSRCDLSKICKWHEKNEGDFTLTLREKSSKELTSDSFFYIYGLDGSRVTRILNSIDV
jgi:NDP-sugar pyrophosphorylase family protein